MQSHLLRANRFLTVRYLWPIAVLALGSAAFAGTSPYAETVIINGKVIMADNDDPDRVTIAEAIAIRGDQILAVGSNDEIKALIADWTEVIDAKGNSVIPGLIDTHNHLYEHTLDFGWVVTSIPEMLEIRIRAENSEELVSIIEQAIQARARQIPGGITGGNSNVDKRSAHSLTDTDIAIGFLQGGNGILHRQHLRHDLVVNEQRH